MAEDHFETIKATWSTESLPLLFILALRATLSAVAVGILIRYWGKPSE
jgi:hypothetical protein